ncbi:unnamed protein product [Sphagnum jensenii]|uniref:Protein kinase domain-containing protein n=1 Tax=Sphagnum jensenii TaxID=128206 RepID=A0ABP1B5Z1_9BRYO
MMMNGTPQWMAPKVLLQKEQGLESDIWSLGCTVVEMATGGRAPWAHIAAAADPFVALYCIGCTDEVPPTPASLSPQAHDFLAHCFQREPCKRWTAAQLLQHPFLKAPPPPPSGLQSSNTHHQAPVLAAASSSPTSVLLDHATNTSSLLLSSVPPLCTPSFWKKLAALEFPRKTRPHEMEEAGGATGNNKNSNMWPLSPLAEGEWIVVRSPKAISIPNKQFPQAPHELQLQKKLPGHHHKNKNKNKKQRVLPLQRSRHHQHHHQHPISSLRSSSSMAARNSFPFHQQLHACCFLLNAIAPRRRRRRRSWRRLPNLQQQS